MIKQVECITDNYECLTKGKIYDVYYNFLNVIVVKNDLGYKKDYPKTAFAYRKDYKTNNDKINPSYYGKQFDVIDFCQKNNLDFMQGNVIKYVTRYKEKNGKEDLLKAMKYIERMIKEIDNQEKRTSK